MSKKVIVMTIIGMFLLTSIATFPGISMSTVETERGLTPPDDIITIEPKEPNGNFKWYITPVYVTFHASDPLPSSGLDYIKYRVIPEGEDENTTLWETHNITEYCTKYNFTIPLGGDVGIVGDGRYIKAEFYAVDNAKNKGPVHSTQELLPYHIKIDTTPPTIALGIEKITLIKYNITAVAEDATSGVYYVQFYIDDEPKRLITSPPYQYTYEARVFLEGFKTTVKAEVCDYAGNTTSTSENIPYSINIDTQQPADLRSFLQRVSSSGASNYESENPNLLGEILRKIFTSRTPTTASSLINTIFNKLLSL